MAPGQAGDHLEVETSEQLAQLAVWDGCAERNRHPVPLIERRASRTSGYVIPCHRPNGTPADTNPVTVAEAARELGIVPSTVHRWIADGFIPAEQITPARRGASGSPTNCAPASSNTPPTATCPCSKPPTPSACPARRTRRRPRPHRTQKRPTNKGSCT
ncbi:MAG TPA: helix-turn-helix domain-containing protein, partial [Mycobacterium sp.]|nr:helix-turn-helix domain-containing protein [Mycobacterium sp.]